mmetsp:Transcript_22381/g.25908  ORF Transcript_22381/g.25908 Transcript_22381/m.25908 type:complete len:200 (-) Transcript_22381:11-610(-)
MRSKLLLHNILLFLFKGKNFLSELNSKSIRENSNVFVSALEFLLDLFLLIVAQSFNVVDNCLKMALVLALTNSCLIQVSFDSLDESRLRELSGSNHLLLCSVCVAGQIVASSVSVTNDFDPTIRSKNFSIPAVRSIVSHFSLQVLSESDTSFFQTASLQEQEGSNEEVGQSLIVNDLLSNSFTDGEISARLAVSVLDLS